jgi:hypothetical protein
MNQRPLTLFLIHLHQHPPHLSLKTKTLICISAKKKQSRVPKKNLKQSIELLSGTSLALAVQQKRTKSGGKISKAKLKIEDIGQMASFSKSITTMHPF